MNLDPTALLAGIGVAALAAQWLAWRFNTPSIVFLLTFGIIAGPMLAILNADLLLGDLLSPIV